jgi:hypothetical protein
MEKFGATTSSTPITNPSAPAANATHNNSAPIK